MSVSLFVCVFFSFPALYCRLERAGTKPKRQKVKEKHHLPRKRTGTEIKHERKTITERTLSALFVEWMIGAATEPRRMGSNISAAATHAWLTVGKLFATD